MQPDMFDDVASEMALVHNMAIRGLNSIYLQAPHIQPGDEKAFCRYIGGWYLLLHSHHAGEEAMLFTWIEDKTGVEGIMETNREQHKSFHDAIDEFHIYADAVIAGTEKYDGGKVVAMIDVFGEPLIQHLRDEIPTIVGLRQYGEKVAGMDKLFAQEAEKAMVSRTSRVLHAMASCLQTRPFTLLPIQKELGMPGLVFACANLDQHFEDDMWASFPPAPAPLKFLLRSVFWWMHADFRKFGASDRAGNLRPLYAVPVSA
jgi:hypothetical protein